MTDHLPHIAVVMTVHNRRLLTLRCLNSLFAQRERIATLTLYMVDDGCTDGTVEAVKTAYPDVVVIAGSGGLYWGGGMALAMREAVSHPFDFMLWLNDDVILDGDAIDRLVRAHRQRPLHNGMAEAIIVGAVTDPDTGNVSYAGFNRRNWWHPAQVTPVHPQPGTLVPCGAMNGNCVLIPNPVVETIGIIDGALVHRYGDIDYGYRARQAGFDIYVAPVPVGTCTPSVRPDRHGLTKDGIAARWKVLTAPLGTPLRPMFRFLWRHGGLLGALAGGWTTVKLAGRAIRGW